jgi:hypothetical protein
MTEPTEYAEFVASVSEFDCSVAKEFPLATSASLEIPFYGRPGTDDIELEILVNYSVWDDEGSTWSEQTIKIDKFDVSVNGGLKIPSESFEKLQPLGGVYRADISPLMKEDPDSRALDYHVLSVRLLDETLLLGEPGAREVPIVRAQAIVYLNRVQ